jgi:hypothetical protein
LLAGPTGRQGFEMLVFLVFAALAHMIASVVHIWGPL